MFDLTLPLELSGKHGNVPGAVWNLVINRDYENLLMDSGVACFTDLYDLSNATIVKKQMDRSVLRFELKGHIFFLKRHMREKCQKGDILVNTPFSWCSEGGKEFAFFHLFRLHKLATTTPVAMGEQIFPDDTVQSFFLSEDFSPYIQLEYIIRHTPEVLAGAKNSVKRKNILQAVGQYARAMHQAGFNHKDFNATHVLLHDLDLAVPGIALFDLQRVDQNTWQRFRWPIKALAEFNYSSRENDLFTDAERLFLFHTYKNKVDDSLNYYEKIQWHWIKAKTNRIARHTAKRHARNSSFNRF